MPQIIVTADQAHERDHDGVMLQERVNVADFESERFAANLIERLGWAVVDATEIEQTEQPSQPHRLVEPAHRPGRMRTATPGHATKRDRGSQPAQVG